MPKIAPALDHAEQHRVVDEEHPDHEREQAQRGQVELEGGGELRDGARGFARGDDARARRQQPRHLGHVPLAVLEDEVHVADAARHAQEPLRRAHVHQQQAVEGALSSPAPGSARGRARAASRGGRRPAPAAPSLERGRGARRTTHPRGRPWNRSGTRRTPDRPRRRRPGGRGRGLRRAGRCPARAEARGRGRGRSRRPPRPEQPGAPRAPRAAGCRPPARGPPSRRGPGGWRGPRRASVLRANPSRAAELARSIATTTATPSAMPRTISPVCSGRRTRSRTPVRSRPLGITRAFRSRSIPPGRRAPPPRRCASPAAASCRPCA